MKNLIRKILREEFKKDKTITCNNCGWSWKLSEGGDDPYVCHKCWTDNTKKETIKEGVENLPVSVGDIFRIKDSKKQPSLIIITKIICDAEKAGQINKHTIFGTYSIYHDGCDVYYEKSIDGGKTFSSDGNYYTELNWMPYIIENGHWRLVHKGSEDIYDFFPD